MKSYAWSSLAFVAALLLSVAPASAQEAACIVLIDEDMIDNDASAIEELANEGICGAGSSAACINDQFADPGVRIPLSIPFGTIIGNGAPGGTDAALATGQTDDEGVFIMTQVPQSWVDAGPTTSGMMNFWLAQADGFGENGEFLLDEIPGVTPLDATGLQELVGQTICAVVYDSDISINDDDEGNLQGANLGVISFLVLAVGPDPAGRDLPDLTIQVINPVGCPGCEVANANDETTWGNVKSLFR